jgi:hypothetical protein
MPQGEPRITNPIENVAWFSSQFGLHVEQIHPEIAARKWTGNSGKQYGQKAQRTSLKMASAEAKLPL